jgi:hypothetical protein
MSASSVTLAPLPPLTFANGYTFFSHIIRHNPVYSKMSFSTVINVVNSKWQDLSLEEQEDWNTRVRGEQENIPSTKVSIDSPSYTISEVSR